MMNWVMSGVSVLIWLVLLHHMFGRVETPSFILPSAIVVAIALFLIKVMMVRKEE
jgi:hypothetical protein